MLAKPERIVDREREWTALARFIEERGRLALLYGPRRVGKSFLLEGLSEATGGVRYQAIVGIRGTQLADFGDALGEWLGAGPLRLESWADAFARVARLELPFLAIDELPYLLEPAPELPSVLQRYVDSAAGPPLILSGSALSVMSELAAASAPLHGRAAAMIVPGCLVGRDLAALWGTENPLSLLWIDSALGGLPGYRPTVRPPQGDLDAWMVDDVLHPGSALLDAAQADLAELPAPMALRGIYRSILSVIASGEHSFGAIARVAGIPSGALSRPLRALERAGLVSRTEDVLRARRDRYELADAHLRFWLAVIEPNRSVLAAGGATSLWPRLASTTWRSQVLGPRWEEIVREHLRRGAEERIGSPDVVGGTSVSERAGRRRHELDVVALREGRVIAIGEAKLRRLDARDLERLLHLRELLGAPEAEIVLASATGFAQELERNPALTMVDPARVYGISAG